MRSSHSPSRRERSAGGGVRRSPATLIVHLSEDGPALLEGAGPLSPETAERLACDARRLTIKPSGRDLVHSRVGRCASYAQQRALHKRSAHCQYPGCTAARELEAHHVERSRARRQDRARQPHPALPPPPQTAARPPHPHERQPAAAGVHRRAGTRDHRQPATRATALTWRPGERGRIAAGRPGLLGAPARRQRAARELSGPVRPDCPPCSSERLHARRQRGRGCGMRTRGPRRRGRAKPRRAPRT